MIVIPIAIATFVATFIGGLVALRFKDKLHLILGFSAGAVIGVAFFDLMPESIALSKETFDIGTVATMIAIGFMTYLILDRLIFLHTHSHDQDDEITKRETSLLQRGYFGAASLSFHSLLDGLAIGLAFQASIAIGAIVTIAVLTHDFSDGVNTVTLILKNHGDKSVAVKWLTVDALAPIVGASSTLFFTVPTSTLGIILAVFCGFFLYIGASDLVPESHHAHPRLLTTIMTLVGAGVMYAVIHIVG